MLTASDLCCVRGERRIFAGLDFRLENGAWLYVTGANGAGKTSLLRMLCGLTPAADGEIRWNGTLIGELGEAFHQSLLYLGHYNTIQESLTARENVQVAAALAGLAIGDAEAEAALARIGLRGREDLPVRFLSQGQKRRVALSRLMWSEAPLWILDEPFVALDTASLALLSGTLDEHLARGGMVVLTSHQDVEIAGRPAQTLHLSS